jgi:phosphate-selective porin
MLRTRVCLAAVLLAASFHTASAQTATTPATPAPTATTTDAKPPGKIKLTMQKLKQMKATWAANKPKLKACRAEVKAKGLIGDDRWFYIQDCMDKT